MPIAFAFRHFNGYDITWRGVLANPHDGSVMWLQDPIKNQTRAQAVQAARARSLYMQKAAAVGARLAA